MFSKPGVRRAELNNEMLRYRYAVSNTGSSARGLKFSEICEKKIKVLCEQARELTDDLHVFLDYVLFYLI